MLSHVFHAVMISILEFALSSSRNLLLCKIKGRYTIFSHYDVFLFLFLTFNKGRMEDAFCIVITVHVICYNLQGTYNYGGNLVLQDTYSLPPDLTLKP